MKMVWTRERLQCSCHGSFGAKFGRPIQLLLKAIHNENCPDAG